MAQGLILTLVKAEDGERDLVRPRRALLQPDAVAGAPEEVAGRDEVAVPRGLELQPRAVPDERVQIPAKNAEDEMENQSFGQIATFAFVLRYDEQRPHSVCPMDTVEGTKNEANVGGRITCWVLLLSPPLSQSKKWPRTQWRGVGQDH